MSSFLQAQAGVGNAPSYLVSGIPWLTGGTLSSGSFSTNNGQVKFDFPFVSRTITVTNRSDGGLRVHFTSANQGNTISGHHYRTLSGSGQSFTFNVKAREVFLSLENGDNDVDFEVTAELTTIHRNMMFNYTGSGLTQ